MAEMEMVAMEMEIAAARVDEEGDGDDSLFCGSAAPVLTFRP